MYEDILYLLAVSHFFSLLPAVCGWLVALFFAFSRVALVRCSLLRVVGGPRDSSRFLAILCAPFLSFAVPRAWLSLGLVFFLPSSAKGKPSETCTLALPFSWRESTSGLGARRQDPLDGKKGLCVALPFCSAALPFSCLVFSGCLAPCSAFFLSAWSPSRSSLRCFLAFA